MSAALMLSRPTSMAITNMTTTAARMPTRISMRLVLIRQNSESASSREPLSGIATSMGSAVLSEMIPATSVSVMTAWRQRRPRP